MTADTIRPDYYRPENLYFTCIDLAEQYTFDTGNLIKYMFRLTGKDDARTNMGKAVTYALRAAKRGETFMPERTGDSIHDAADMLDTLTMTDWQGAGDFWAALAGVARGETTKETVLATLTAMAETIAGKDKE